MVLAMIGEESDEEGSGMIGLVEDLDRPFTFCRPAKALAILRNEGGFFFCSFNFWFGYL